MNTASNPNPLQYVPDKYVNAKQVAKILNVSIRTVRNMQEDGRLTRHNVGRSVKFLLSEVEAYRDGKRKGKRR